MMTEIAAQYPLYDIASNKGYRSPKHLAALKAHGPVDLHRKSFAPVWNALHPQEELFGEEIEEEIPTELLEQADAEASDALVERIEHLDH
jgi:hypothetical protein